MVAELAAPPTTVYCSRCGTPRQYAHPCLACLARSAPDRAPVKPGARTAGRLVAERFRRIWYLVEHVAATPGQTRAELAAAFHLSERQIQADLNIIRTDMRLPLIRRGGYRLVAEGGAEAAPDGMTLADALTLVLVTLQARHVRTISADRLARLIERLPRLCPPHLAPLVARLLDADDDRRDQQARVLVALADAILRDARVVVRSAPGVLSLGTDAPTIRPQLLLPYLNQWYVLAETPHRSYGVMLPVRALTDVEDAHAGH